MDAKKLHVLLTGASLDDAMTARAMPARNGPRQNTQGALAPEQQARMQDFIASLPGMACQILRNSQNEISFPYVSEGSLALLGLLPHELARDARLFTRMLHPDDRKSYEMSLQASADNLSFWNWEGRIVLPPGGETKWINLRCTPRRPAPEEIRWEGIMFNINQSKLAEIEARHAQEQLRELSAHIQDVREQERLGIAREVHDNLGSILTAIKLNIAWMGKRLDAEETALGSKIRDIEQLTDKGLIAVGNISRTLRPSTLESFGIIAAVESEVREFEQRTGIACLFNHIDQGITLPGDASIALFRIVQEAMTNIMKHARASRVKVDICNLEDCISLVVSDDGRGLAGSDRLKPNSFGLRGIQERVAYFGGEINIVATPGGGTTLSIFIPHHAESRASAGSPQPQQALF